MNIESYRTYCLNKKGVTVEFPFGPDTLVFKVMGKMFTAAHLAEFESINLKCDPEVVIELREKYDAVREGYHMNKKHWITVLMDGSVPDNRIQSWIDHSYEQVVKGLNKSIKLNLNRL